MSTRAGRWEKQITGYRAFVPKPLPPDPPLRWDADLLRVLSERSGRSGVGTAWSEACPTRTSLGSWGRCGCRAG